MTMNVVTKSYTPAQLSKLLQVTQETLREWHRKGRIEATTTKGGHRRYIYHQEIEAPYSNERDRKKYIYARVSSSKQKGDLERQIAFLQERYPGFEVIKDVGSGINFQRKGLLFLLEQVMSGTVSTVVVAHRDRLCRIGFDLFRFLLEKWNVKLEVLDDPAVKEPLRELSEDMLSIITVFTARYYGSRKYKVLQKNKDISHPGAKVSFQQVSRGVKVLLQQNRKRFERPGKPQRDAVPRNPKASGDGK